MTKDTSMTWEAAVVWLRNQPGNGDLIRACFYDDPLLEAAKRYAASTEWLAVRKFMPANPGRALDIGAGRGISSFALAQDGWKTTALEPDPSSIVGAGAIKSLSAASGLDIAVVETWGEDLPFSDGSFDLVHCRQVLHHARDLNKLCLQIARVLKPGGRMIATREHVISSPEDLPKFLAAHPLHDLYGGEHAYLLSEYTGAIKEAGLTIKHTLNPLASEINTYPHTLAQIKMSWAKRLRVVPPQLIPDFALSAAAAVSDTPGRVYTFVCEKPL